MTTRLSNYRIVLALLAALLLHSPAFAHTALSNSVPADGQTLNAAPVLHLEFNGTVSLLRLEVRGKDGEVDIGFTPGASTAAVHEVTLPALPDGRYVVDWTIIGADGHRISKSFSFTLDAAAAAAGSGGSAG
jgi:methionine-rich copper-binding protein CopC